MRSSTAMMALGPLLLLQVLERSAAGEISAAVDSGSDAPASGPVVREPMIQMHRLQDPSSPSGVAIIVVNREKLITTFTLSADVFDLLGTFLRRESHAFSLDRDESKKILVGVSPEERVAVVRAELKSADGETIEQAQEWVAIEPASLDRIDGSERFGLCMFPYLPKSQEDRMIRLVQACGCKCVRGFEMDRCYDEANKGIVPQRMDRITQRLREAGVSCILSILAYSPTWASTVPEDRPEIERRFAMPHLDVWTDLVRKYVVSRNFDAFEVWNEPNGGFWNTYPKNETYATLLKATYKAIKEVRPDAAVVGGSANNGSTGWPESVLNVAPGCMDVVSFHSYRYGGRINSPEVGTSAFPSCMDLIDRLKRMTAAHNQGKPLPIWNTEFGYLCPEDLDADFDMHDQAKYLIRSFLVLAAEQVERSFCFMLRDQGPAGHTFGLCTSDWSVKPSWLAFRTLNRHAASRSIGPLRQISKNLFAVTLKGGEDNVLALWSVERPVVAGTRSDVVFARGLYDRDIAGRKVGDLNAYVIPAGSVIYLSGKEVDESHVTPLLDLRPQTESVIYGESPVYDIHPYPKALEYLGTTPVTCTAEATSQPQIGGKYAKGYGRLVVNGQMCSFVVSIAYKVVDSISASLAYGRDGSAEIVIKNGAPTREEVHLRMEAAAKFVEHDVAISPRSIAHQALGLTFPDPSRGLPVTVNVEHKTQRWTLQQEMWAKVTVPFTAVGFADLAMDHGTMPPIHLVVWEKNAGDKPESPGDLAAAMALAYDEEYLYLLVDVDDDVHRQPCSGSATWMGDSVQLAFATESNPAGTEMLFYRTDDGRKGLYTFDLNLNVDNVRFEVGRDRTNTTYKIAFPLSLFQMKPQPGQSLRFSLIVNENDTGAREGYLRWADGIGRTKAPSQYGILILSN